MLAYPEKDGEHLANLVKIYSLVSGEARPDVLGMI